MKHLSLIAAFALATGALSLSAAPKPPDAASLESVLKKMDDVAATFRATQAEFEWDNYQKAIDEVIDVETGTIYYRRSGQDIEMMANVRKSGTSLSDLKAEPKYVLISGGKARMYLPKPDQVTEYDLGKNRSDFESYLVLGFGGSGKDLKKAFEVTYQGPETIGRVATAKLRLVPKSENVRKLYSEIVLWVDVERGISVQQQFFQSQGDYRLAKYSGIKVNEKIDNDVFKLKTTSKTQTLTPHG